jgi:hypothetical protein
VVRFVTDRPGTSPNPPRAGLGMRSFMQRIWDSGTLWYTRQLAIRRVPSEGRGRPIRRSAGVPLWPKPKVCRFDDPLHHKGTRKREVDH